MIAGQAFGRSTTPSANALEGGHVALSAAVADLPAAAIAEVIEAVRAFERFDADNDPHGEHDFGSFDVGGERVFWKIDYYDRSLRGHSPDAADPAVTTRVLTIMIDERLLIRARRGHRAAWRGSIWSA